MRAAVVVASKHGTTTEIGRRVARALGGDVPVLDLAENHHPDLAGYDTVVLGTAVYIGQPLASMKAFAQAADLSEKRIGLYVSGMQPGSVERTKELESAYPAGLAECAQASAFLGGRFELDKLSRFERFVVKRTAKVTADVDAIDDQAIDEFARQLQAEGRMA